MMKKFVNCIAAVILLLTLLSALSACGEQPKVVGSWSCTDSLQFTRLNMKPNGTFTFESSNGDHTGTWEMTESGDCIFTITASSAFNVPTTLSVVFDGDNTLVVKLSRGGSIGTFVRE